MAGAPFRGPFFVSDWTRLMGRSVLMVDAGYLFAQGGRAAHGTRTRNLLSIDARGFLTTLTEMVVNHSGLPLLRTYWYDGARNGIPTKDQLEIAELPYLKLRLGRLNSRNQQKGVDSLVYRDLMTLASERSIAQAYLLSGDDDLREGVLFAQDRGVRVILLGIADRQGDRCQSRELQYEVDEVVSLDNALISRSIRIAGQPHKAPLFTANQANQNTVAETSSKFAGEWHKDATEDARLALIEEFPRIPMTLDSELIRECERALGFSLRSKNQKYLRELARHAFWQTIKKLDIWEDDSDGT